MEILVFGKDGQVGSSFRRIAALAAADASVNDRGGDDDHGSAGVWHFAGRDEVDLTQAGAAAALIEELQPDLVINAAAYTAVDKAESEPELSEAINARAPGEMATACEAIGSTFVHYSTDYVFDGSADRAYAETDPPAPLGVYGRTKLEGERAVAAATPRHLILRTSWVYDATGQNFLNTMLRLAADRPELSVVADQRGAPTFADDLAAATLALSLHVIETDDDDHFGVYHVSGQGETTWHGFASRIFELAAISIPCHPITTADYPTPAPRPAFSVLDNTKLESLGVGMAHWEDALSRCMSQKAV